MKVQGVAIPPRVENDAVAFLKTRPSFRSQDLQRFLEMHPGISDMPWKPSGLAMRAADRIIQRERKAGTIGPAEADRAHSVWWRWSGE